MMALLGWFNADDDASPYWPVVLGADAAEAIYGDADPIGQKIEEDETVTHIVVGVVETYRKDGEVAGPDQLMFRRIAANAVYGRLGSHLLVRVHPGAPADFEQTLVTRLEQILPNVPFRVRHMERMRTNMLRTRLAPVVVGGIVGGFLIAMVGLGLTGVLWQSVTRRTREIGLRRAMGASGPNVHRQILGEVALLTRNINNSEGTLGLLIRERELYDRLLETAAQASTTVQGVQALINDRDIRIRIRQIVDNLNVFVQKIAADPGRLARGVIDRETPLRQ